MGETKDLVNQLSDEQFEKVVAMVKEVAKRGNQFAQAINLAWANKPLAHKRAIFGKSYSAMFELMVVIEMTLKSDKSVDEIKEGLQALQ